MAALPLSPDQFVTAVFKMDGRVDGAAVVQTMLDDGQVADIDAVGRVAFRACGWVLPPMTALAVAVGQGNLPVTVCLVANGARMQMEGARHTPLTCAISHACVNTCRFLLAEGADTQCVGVVVFVLPVDTVPPPNLPMDTAIQQYYEEAAIQQAGLNEATKTKCRNDDCLDVCAMLFAYGAPHAPCARHCATQCACVLPAIATECARYERVVREVAWERRLRSVHAWVVWNSNTGYSQFKF